MAEKCNCTNCDCPHCLPKDAESWDGEWTCDADCNHGEAMEDCCSHKEK
jgi:hypothetical protein